MESDVTIITLTMHSLCSTTTENLFLSKCCYFSFRNSLKHAAFYSWLWRYPPVIGTLPHASFELGDVHLNVLKPWKNKYKQTNIQIQTKLQQVTLYQYSWANLGFRWESLLEKVFLLIFIPILFVCYRHQEESQLKM